MRNCVEEKQETRKWKVEARARRFVVKHLLSDFFSWPGFYLTRNVQTTLEFETVREWSLLTMAGGGLRGELSVHIPHMKSRFVRQLMCMHCLVHK